MNKRLTGKALANFEAKGDVWQEVLDSVREIKASSGKRKRIEAKSYVVRLRRKSCLSQAEFAAVLGLSKRTLARIIHDGSSRNRAVAKRDRCAEP
ncbi:MAG: hypothetical protein P0120_20295 [Nitrospira sp.]|nr:hypothetical protein [Nitrospira sp.]